MAHNKLGEYIPDKEILRGDFAFDLEKNQMAATGLKETDAMLKQAEAIAVKIAEETGVLAKNVTLEQCLRWLEANPLFKGN